MPKSLKLAAFELKGVQEVRGECLLDQLLTGRSSGTF